MRPDLHLDPDRLRAHAARVGVLAERLASLRAPDPESLVRAGRTVVERTEELTAAVSRVASTVAELSSALRSVAADAERVDQVLGSRVFRAGWDAR